MELSTNEAKALGRLRERHKRWQWLRYVFVGYGLIGFGTSSYYVFDSFHTLSGIVTGARAMPESTLMLVSVNIIMHVVHLALAVFSVILVWWGFINWAGNPTDILLLRLLQAAPETDESNAKR